MWSTSSFDPYQLRDDAQAWIDRGKQVLPEGLGELLAKRDGAGELIARLPQVYTPSQVAVPSPEQDAWGFVGLFYRAQARYREAIPVYLKLYDHMLAAQEQDRVRYHKGMPLIWISDCYREIGYTLVSRRYLMLTLVEDALRDKGSILPSEGVYFRAVSIAGMAQNEVGRYPSEAYSFSEDKPTEALYPERVLQQLDRRPWRSVWRNLERPGGLSAFVHARMPDRMSAAQRHARIRSCVFDGGCRARFSLRVWKILCVRV